MKTINILPLLGEIFFMYFNQNIIFQQTKCRNNNENSTISINPDSKEICRNTVQCHFLTKFCLENCGNFFKCYLGYIVELLFLFKLINIYLIFLSFLIWYLSIDLLINTILKILSKYYQKYLLIIDLSLDISNMVNINRSNPINRSCLGSSITYRSVKGFLRLKSWTPLALGSFGEELVLVPINLCQCFLLYWAIKRAFIY